MCLPWWTWIITGLWCGPGVHCIVAFLVQKPINGGLTDEGEPFKPLSLGVRMMLFPLLFVLLLALWPLELWAEIHESRLLVRTMRFVIQFFLIVATWPLLLWREVKEGRR